MNKIKIYFTTVKGRRNSNEDRHNIILNMNNNEPNINKINLLSIYDGHGGSFVSEYLEKNIPLYYCNKKLEYPFSEEYHHKIFENLQNKILKFPNGHSSGSTCLLNIMYNI